MFHFFTIRLFLFSIGVTQVAQVFGQSSVLRSGSWYKVAVEKHGVYKITYDDFRKMGFDTNVDPRRIQVFGNGGGMLPQAISVSRPLDLTQNAIFVSGESDGTFDKGDFILFYAEGPDRVNYNVQREIFAYESNLYSEKNFYFVTIGDADGKRITVKPNLEGNFSVIQHYDDYVYHELDEHNVLSSGREWFGERFDLNSEKTFTIPISGILENSPIKVVSDVMGQSFSTSSFNLFWNNTLLKNQVIPTIPNSQYGVKGVHKKDTISLNSTEVNAAVTSTQEIKYQFVKASSGASAGNLDFFLLNVKRTLEFSEHQILFRSRESLLHPTSTFSISNTSANCIVWDVTQPSDAQLQDYTLDGATTRFSTASDQLREYIIFDSEVSAPELIGKVENQNLHGLSTPNLIIVSHPQFVSEAERLAAHRAQHNSWTTVVVTPDQIFLEFSSGRQDVTAIRDFVKYLYDKNPDALKSLLLMGKGSYDYK
ncbi:MAG TPA: C25 family cysteine peptidase, partial [Chryseolinea sp.]|nr:C25 family cysteine peptidase [Chryseolinea sp.]